MRFSRILYILYNSPTPLLRALHKNSTLQQCSKIDLLRGAYSFICILLLVFYHPDLTYYLIFTAELPTYEPLSTTSVSPKLLALIFVSFRTLTLFITVEFESIQVLFPTTILIENRNSDVKPTISEILGTGSLRHDKFIIHIFSILIDELMTTQTIVSSLVQSLVTH